MLPDGLSGPLGETVAVGVGVFPGGGTFVDVQPPRIDSPISIINKNTNSFLMCFNLALQI
jgi:hypothetical protein